MTAEILKKKTTRYLQGRALPAETRQIQTWLSCTDDAKTTEVTVDKESIEQQILAEIQAHTAYPLFHPQPQSWWQKMTQRLKD